MAVLAAVVLGLASCSSDSGTAPEPSASPTLSALQRAEQGLLPYDQTPPAPPGTIVDSGGVYTAEGDQVAAPWAQFMVCPVSAGRPDEGPPTDVEPNALAGAWVFGGAGAAQLDQYSIVYSDTAAAEAAVSRARTQADRCDETYTANHEYVGDPPETQVGEVPGSVAGFRVYALFTHDGGKSKSDWVSTVMRYGDVVHYMRTQAAAYETESGDDVPAPSKMLDPQWIEALIQAAADHLSGTDG